MRQAIDLRRKKLDSFFNRASHGAIPEELQADLARLGAILICGFVERSVELIILDRLSTRAHPRVLNFIKSYFKRGTNYDCAAMCRMLERFDVNWSNKFKRFLDSRPILNESLDSVYTLRNSIAHGGDANRGLRGIMELHEAAVNIIDGLIESTT